MGVLACDRNGCENIMCDHYSSRYGYLCRECLNELILKGPTDIDVFMGSPKDEIEHVGRNWEDELFQEFEAR